MRCPNDDTTLVMSERNGVEIDYVSSVMGAGFTFKNPNATGSCGCGSSFTA